MCGSMVDIQSAAAEIRWGIKKIEDRKKPQGKNIMSASATQGGHNNGHLVVNQYSTTCYIQQEYALLCVVGWLGFNSTF